MKSDQIAPMINKLSLKLKNQLNVILKSNNYDLTIDQFEILALLWEREGLIQSQIAEILCKDKTGITRLLDSLEKKNYIHRKPDANDRRAYHIYLSEKAKFEKTGLTEIISLGSAKCVNNLSNFDVAKLLELLKVVDKNI